MKSNTYMAVYATFPETEAAVTRLQNDNFDMKRLSIAGTYDGTEKHLVGCYSTGNGLIFTGPLGVLWTRLSTSLTGWGAFWSSASRLVLVLGPLAKAIVTGQEDSSPATGTNDFGAGLFAIGVPQDSIIHYQQALMNNQFLLLVHGSADEIERAFQSLIETDPINGTLHHGVGLLP